MDPARRPSCELPQGRKAARVSGLWRVCGGSSFDGDVVGAGHYCRRVSQHLALYRKYRSATFAEVIGQDHVTVPLRQALAAKRINHAYLFSGPRGCGKTSSARILARCLNCRQGPTADPCGVCEACVEIAQGRDIDVLEIDAATNTQVDKVREVIIAGGGFA